MSCDHFFPAFGWSLTSSLKSKSNSSFPRHFWIAFLSSTTQRARPAKVCISGSSTSIRTSPTTPGTATLAGGLARVSRSSKSGRSVASRVRASSNSVWSDSTASVSPAPPAPPPPPPLRSCRRTAVSVAFVDTSTNMSKRVWVSLWRYGLQNAHVVNRQWNGIARKSACVTSEAICPEKYGGIAYTRWNQSRSIVYWNIMSIRTIGMRTGMLPERKRAHMMLFTRCTERSMMPSSGGRKSS